MPHRRRQSEPAISFALSSMTRRDAHLRSNAQDSLPKTPYRTDREVSEREECLRRRWGGNDPAPESFNPRRLEETFMARFSSKSRKEKASETREITRGDPYHHFEHAVSSDDDDDDDDDHASPSTSHSRPLRRTSGARLLRSLSSKGKVHTNHEANSLERSKTTRERPSPGLANGIGARRGNNTAPERSSSPPRIRRGSRPPLSRSAFVVGGVPCADEVCMGSCKKPMRKGKKTPKAPEYFPYMAEGKTRRPSKSQPKDKDAQLPALKPTEGGWI